MPTYEYSCIACDISKEVNRSISEYDHTEICEKCGCPMNKVYGSFGIQFKGTGFYKTDNPK